MWQGQNRTQTAEFTVGLVLRRGFRRLLRSRGLQFTEDKGWLDSQFIVSGPGNEIGRLYDFVQRASVTA
jgi:hypothetical protein